MSTSDLKEPVLKPIAYECRFAFYAQSNRDDSDVHLVKEIHHFADGTTKPYLRTIKNHKRPFYVTKKGAQNHKSKKEFELMDNLIRFDSTQCKLKDAVASALNMQWSRGTMRDLQASPYLYGTDITSTALLKQSYQDRYPDTITPFKIACFDTETDVLHGTNEIVMATISFKERVFTVVKKSFVAGYSNVIERLQVLAQLYLGEVIAARNITMEFMLVDTEIDIVRATIGKAHEWKPDFLAIWNILFDMDKMITACEKAKVHPADIFNDPQLPRQYRHFEFKIGAAKKVTASGKTMNFKPAQRWHTVFSPASFYLVDAMCAYRQVRQGSAEEPSYALDNILKKHLKRGKLKFTQADQYSGLEWHKVMQEKHPLEYVIYNQFDCISMEMLDEKTLDLQLSMPLFSGCSDFSHFNSQPRRTCDRLDGYVKHYDPPRVMATTASEMAEDFDDETVALSDLIVALRAERVVDNGICIIEENPHMVTNIRIGQSDLDVSAAYPTNEIVANISKETTRKELISVQGVDEVTKRMNAINFSAGHVNAIEFCTSMLNMPMLDALLDDFNRELQAGA